MTPYEPPRPDAATIGFVLLQRMDTIAENSKQIAQQQTLLCKAVDQLQRMNRTLHDAVFGIQAQLATLGGAGAGAVTAAYLEAVEELKAHRGRSAQLEARVDELQSAVDGLVATIGEGG